MGSSLSEHIQRISTEREKKLSFDLIFGPISFVTVVFSKWKMKDQNKFEINYSGITGTQNKK